MRTYRRDKGELRDQIGPRRGTLCFYATNKTIRVETSSGRIEIDGARPHEFKAHEPRTVRVRLYDVRGELIRQYPMTMPGPDEERCIRWGEAVNVLGMKRPQGIGIRAPSRLPVTIHKAEAGTGD